LPECEVLDFTKLNLITIINCRGVKKRSQIRFYNDFWLRQKSQQNLAATAKY